MKKNKAMELVKALRSGKYKQGIGVLVDNQDRFCCLGVVCNISSEPLEWKKKVDNVWSIDDSVYNLPLKIQKEFGFYDPFGRRRDYQDILIGGRKFASLARANDSGIPFSDIADYIEKNWKQL